MDLCAEATVIRSILYDPADGRLHEGGVELIDVWSESPETSIWVAIEDEQRDIEVLENLRASLAAHPRTVWLIYSRPVWRRVVEESRLFSQVEDYSTGGRVNAVFRTD
jgi:hypothetical protein